VFVGDAVDWTKWEVTLPVVKNPKQLEELLAPVSAKIAD
jgi:hypothetical protein